MATIARQKHMEWSIKILSFTMAGALFLVGCAQGRYDLSSQSCDGSVCAVPVAAARPPVPVPVATAPPPPSPPTVTPPPGPVLETIPVTGTARTAAQKAAAAKALAFRLAEEKKKAQSQQAIDVIEQNAERGRQLMAAEKAQLKPAVLAWNTPPKMNPAQAANVELKISRNTTGLALSAAIAAAGATTTTTALLADEVTATLTSQGFTTSAATPETQFLLPEGDRTWIWSIRPKPDSKGTQTLVLTVVSTLDLNSGARGTATQSISRDIYVEVAEIKSSFLMDFLKSDWSKLWTLLVVPAGALIMQMIRRRRAAAADSPLPPIQ